MLAEKRRFRSTPEIEKQGLIFILLFFTVQVIFADPIDGGLDEIEQVPAAAFEEFIEFYLAG